MDEMQKIMTYRSSQWKWKVISLISILIIGALAYYFSTSRKDKKEYSYVTHSLQKGDLSLTVSATGYVQPLESVDVGTEVSGTIKEVYVDYNDLVKTGQSLARLDKTKYQSSVNKAQASLSSAQASLQNAIAQLYKANAIIERDKSLKTSTKGILPSQTDWDSDFASHLAAKAQVENAKAQVDQAENTLVSAQYDLEKTLVKSPIEGIVLVRNVDPGQTVAASFQTPVLFTIAKDLTRMELHVNVDEADIGKIKAGQEATFSVDAYPETVFEAKIKKVHVNSEVLNGVVTYKTVLDVDNKKLLLRPGMSVDADITIETIRDGFIVPRAALLYIPVVVKERKFSIFGDREKSVIDQKTHIWVFKNSTATKIYVKVLGKRASSVAIASDELHIDDVIILAQEKKK